MAKISVNSFEKLSPSSKHTEGLAIASANAACEMTSVRP